MGGGALNGFNVLGTVPWGQCLYNRHDVALGRCIAEYGEFSEDELFMLRQVVPVGSVMLDVGANIGAIAVPMAMHVGVDGAVVAFEPQRLMFQLLCANAALNSVGNLYPVRSAVGQKEGVVSVVTLDPNVANSPGGLEMNAGGDHPTETVAMLAIDDLSRSTLERVSLIKIDVEGMEADVIRGARKTIGTYRPIIYVENDRADKSAELIDLVKGMDYVAYWDLPRLVRRREGEPVEGLAARLSINMLCFPKEHRAVIDLEPVIGRDDNATAAIARFKASHA